MIQTNYNPDVLSCLANLSNDEVFTPPGLVNDMLDMLPNELWSNPETTFLDPVSKSGVFLREMAKRLMSGLESIIPDKQERINHIFTKQLYGIAITDLTALLSRRSVYCSKIANGKYSICEIFDDADGNIRYQTMQHTWHNGKCTYCGASEEVYSRTDLSETYAYNFIHLDNPLELFKIQDMKFDVIVGNPPYQLSDGGNSRSAGPIYNKFIQQAKKLNPRYLTMIVPARWYAGGKGLDDFRAEMLADKRIRKLVDFENSNDVFPGVDVAGGICYFLWDRDNPGLCEMKNLYNGIPTITDRDLDEFPILIRHSRAIPIIRKILSKKENGDKRLSDKVSSRKPFGLPTNYTPKDSGIPCWFVQKIGRKYASQKDVVDEGKNLHKWKLLVPPAPIAGQTDFSKPVGFYYDGNTRISKPGECCTESYIIAGSFNSENETILFKSYLFTKIVRFLLLQTVVSQHVTKDKFYFIPDLGEYDIMFTDEILRQRWDITEDEWNFIDSKIKNIGTNENSEVDE